MALDVEPRQAAVGGPGGRRPAVADLQSQLRCGLRDELERRIGREPKERSRCERFGIDPDADAATRAMEFAAAIRGMREQVGKNGQTARTVQPVNPQTVDEARAMLANRKPRKPSPPPQLNPEALALAVYDNGDERNEWK